MQFSFFYNTIEEKKPKRILWDNFFNFKLFESCLGREYVLLENS